LGGSTHTIKKNTESVVVASKENGLEGNADETKYVVTSWEKNTGSQNIKLDNNSFERVEQFEYLGATATDQNSSPEEIKGKYKSGNASCHSVQNLGVPVCYPRI
jgi:archaellum component FlaG (FlaF/FlaG flagellin family)